MTKTHWLFGRGPDKLLDFKREIDKETDCSKCIHREVCDRDMEKRCENYVFGTSEHAGCHGCSHRYTRFDKDAVPCFSCPWFEELKKASDIVGGIENIEGIDEGIEGRRAVTEQDYRYEQDLREQTRAKGAGDAAQILADFYDQLGQPSRAVLWRDARVRAHRAISADPDQIVRDPKWRRKVMMWLLGHVISHARVARLFRSSKTWSRTLGREIEQKICLAANEERHHPTMKATLRLQAVGALPKPFEPGAFTLGDTPPDDWPATIDRGHWRAE